MDRWLGLPIGSMVSFQLRSFVSLDSRRGPCIAESKAGDFTASTRVFMRLGIAS